MRFLPDGTISNNAIGFFMAAVEFDGDPAPDLVVQHQSSSGIGGLYWLRGKSFTGKEGKTLGKERFERGLKALEEADLNIKRSRLNPQHAVEKAVVELGLLLRR